MSDAIFAIITLIIFIITLPLRHDAYQIIADSFSPLTPLFSAAFSFR
jgi:uncharacterized membrane protein YccF (DUF307 family)